MNNGGEIVKANNTKYADNTSWLHFYMYWRFPICFVVGAILLFVRYRLDSDYFLFFVKGVPIYFVAFSAGIIVYTIRILVFPHFLEMSNKGYRLNIFLLILESINIAYSIGVSTIDFENFFRNSLIAFPFVFGLWAIPNIVYFKHRRFMFSDYESDEATYETTNHDSNIETNKEQDISQTNEELIDNLQNEDKCNLQETVSISSLIPESLPSRLRRVFILIEDEEWEKATDYCEKILDEEPENVYAYLGKLFIETKSNTWGKLREQYDSVSSSKNYRRLCQFAEADLMKQITTLIQHDGKE